MPLIKLAAERRQKQIPPGMQPPENAADWFRIENSTEDSDSTDVFVYDSIGGWFGLYADEFIDALGEVTTSKINLRLNSPGGSVFDGIAIANALRAHPANVTVYVDSLAASIASVIMLAGDKVIMRPQSQVMIHAASGACYGDATEMTKMADLLDFQTRNIAEAYAERTGRPVSEFLELMAAETWFSAKEAVEIGLADEAMPMRPNKGEDAEDPASAVAAQGRVWDLSMYRYAGRDNAPAPKATPFAQGGVVPGTVLTAAMVNQVVQPQPGEPVVPLAVAGMSRDEVLDLIRETVRAEMAVAAPVTEPVAEDAVQPDDSPAAEASEAPVEEAEPVVEDAETTPADPPVPEEIPPDDAVVPETHDEADPWEQVVGFLVSPTSPSADDVFAQLKEGW